MPWFIKRDRPDLIEKFNIPLDEYIGRCEDQLKGWDSLCAEFERSEASAAGDLEIIRRYTELQSDLWLQRMAHGSTEVLEQERASRKREQEERVADGH